MVTVAAVPSFCFGLDHGKRIVSTMAFVLNYEHGNFNIFGVFGRRSSAEVMAAEGQGEAHKAKPKLPS